MLNKKRLKILKAQVTEGTPDDIPGQIARVTDVGIEVGTGQARLIITELQPEGKKVCLPKVFWLAIKLNGEPCLIQLHNQL